MHSVQVNFDISVQTKKQGNMWSRRKKRKREICFFFEKYRSVRWWSGFIQLRFS